MALYTHTHTHTRVNLKDKKAGITLVSLVVTIIILLILAGVTLALISGSDGILGRASHALDENKIAMAKEQVELALSDFQAEFFEGKYVERTNDGTKKEYISEKLQAGVETTNFYAKASAEGNVTVYEGKDSSGTEVVKGAIQEDASIKWDDVASGSLGGNGGSGEGGSGSGEQGSINLQEVAQLKTTIAQLQGEVNDLKEQLKTTIINKKIILMDVPVKIPLTSTLTERDFDIPLKSSIEDYKYLEIQINMHWTDGAEGVLAKTVFLATEQLKYNNSNEVDFGDDSMFALDADGNNYHEYARIFCWFKNSQLLHVGYSDGNFVGSDEIRIKKIYGIQ